MPKGAQWMTQVTTFVIASEISLRHVFVVPLAPALHCNAEDDGPCQDPDVVRIHDGSDRVIDDRKDQVVKDLDNAAWRSQLCFRSHCRTREVGKKKDIPTPTREAQNVLTA